MTAWLTTHGRLTWKRAAEVLVGATCAWADLDGFHEESVPAEAPIATHLWAWTPDALTRLRIDGDDCIGATLHLTVTETPDAEPVEVTTWDSPTWPANEQTVNADARWRNRIITVHQITALVPLTFIQLSERG